MDSEDFRVLVVCTGNINRSALAAALLRTWADWYLPPEVAAHVVVTSAGLAAPAGRPMRSRTRAIAERLGTDGRAHRSVQVDEAAIRAADLVLTADVAHRDGVLGIVPSKLRSTFTIREAGGIAARLGAVPAPASAADLRTRIVAFSRRRELGAADDGDITDPQGRGDDAYRAMVGEEVPPLTSIAASLFGMPKAEVDAVLATVADPEAFPFEDVGREPPGGGPGSPGPEHRRGWLGRRRS